MTSLGLKTAIIVLAIVSTSLFSCKSNKHATSEIPGHQDDAIYGLVVSFYSSGGGIDRQMKADFIAFLEAEFKDVARESTSWGREGEIDYCFPLKEMSSSDKKAFIEASKALLSTSDRVHIHENALCKHKR